MKVKYLIVQKGNEGGAPLMGEYINKILNKDKQESKLVNIEKFIEHNYLYSIAKNISMYDAKVELIKNYISSLGYVPEYIIANSSRVGYVVRAAKELNIKVILYIHEGPDQINIEMNNLNITYEDFVISDHIAALSVARLYFAPLLRSRTALVRTACSNQ